MGEVYRARDTRLDRTVALKVLHARADAAASALPLIEREARAAAALNHPHICTLYDIGHEGDFGYLVMEYLEGKTLEDVLRTGPLSPATVLLYARQLAGALTAAHGKRVIHRDLKPANLFLTNEGTLKILDFGIAKSVVPEGADAVTRRRTTQSGTFIGTVGYAAPEQLRGEPVDHRTDIFAVGVVLSELVAGHPPFARSTTVDTMSAILHEPPPPLPSDVPSALAAAIAKCLEKSPARRFQSAAELLAALDPPVTATGEGAVPSDAPPSIAVLPFADLSPGKDQEYFCDGMADELITALMSLEGVRVASRTSAFQFKGRAEDVGEIGRRLRVRHVLEGSVRRAGNRLRVTVQLTDVAEGFQVWSERYDRALDDVFAVQDEIARTIVERLELDLGRRDDRIVPRATRNMEAYNIYLQGRYLLFKLTMDGMKEGMALLERAGSLQPDYADAHASLAYGYLLQAFTVAPPRQVMPLAKSAAERALRVNPDLAQGHLALASVRHWYDWDWAGAERAYKKAIELSPADAMARFNYAELLALLGRSEEAIAEAARATERDPISPIVCRAMGDALYVSRRYDEAIEYAHRMLALEPSFFSTYWILGLALAGKGQYAEAIGAFEQGRAHSYGDPPLESFLGWVSALAGDRDRARTIARELEGRRAVGYVSATNIALIYQGLGEMDEALRWYTLAVNERAADCSAYQQVPYFDAAREDPRFQALIRRINSGNAPDGS
jgi:TolB-like protein/Flp pilus assembly protein TadD